MRQKGFTLLELLVAVLLIGLVVVIYVASWSRAQAKARDGRRKADLAIIKVALETFFNDHNTYPAKSDLVFGNPLIYQDPLTLDAEEYMSKVPRDPLYPKNNYCYTPVDAGGGVYLSYTLGADYETETRECGPLVTPGPTPTDQPPGYTPLPSEVPTPAPTAQPATPAPTPTPEATHLPSGVCSPCNMLNPSNALSGYCCAVSPNEFYMSSTCQTPPIGYGGGGYDCSISCPAVAPDPAPWLWRQVSLPHGCKDQVWGNFAGNGCGVSGCGAVTDDCGIPVDPAVCDSGFLKVSCLCY